MNVRFGRCHLCRRWRLLHAYWLVWLCADDLEYTIHPGWEER